MKEFNYIGLKCPIPVLKAYKEIKKNPKENDFKFICNDPSAKKDFQDLCKNTGFKLSKTLKEKDNIIIFINRH